MREASELGDGMDIPVPAAGDGLTCATGGWLESERRRRDDEALFSPFARDEVGARCMVFTFQIYTEALSVAETR